ncbi:lactoylglutathione lyase [Chryseobacterium sp. P1-3]|uniref:VOC family protein n=1 Tax=Chryseobacterium gallinarum TaxID=1324352 RepID=A0ABX6KS32_CHRGL|nr:MULTISPECIES: VOC family protein [Chryseobacterium]KFF75069.1 lactoylglutathione lyase [Chryseobacterium sp. P1-3]MCL8536450.1 VOC family protein [Chryseobacterium gallinarum]QIY91425.1 VOC family protein [Chryseobacterium gallinarum]
MKFHHVGVACKDIQTELQNIRKLHKIVEETPVVFDPNQQAELCMVTVEDGLNIEFVSGKPVENLLKKRISYYHICYEVEDIVTTIDLLTQNGGMLISPPKEAILFDNRKVAFLMLPYGIIELLNSN